ncbi:filamentous hemagglutinin N-terminal domain-containing protein [Blastomonas sp.]|uniref:two-partner secretion domain-containing protein n=1 Tax=Blastomonas sp. TaxID=1909299 RepID=UPI002605D1C9|nr:filamentous hemagglutinin N-terminal domain-containing protein [Blastomonas sp.]MDM7955899.1 filamentous hemagglutinin N-terminal domain-containing protein [Blastomonas sp.]
MRPIHRALLASALALQAGLLAAQEAIDTQTAIHPDTLASLSTGTTAIADGAVTMIGGGVRAGDNLFHSFARFSLAEGDIARWTASDALTIRNVINRVTGGEGSFIGGTIDASAMPGADFFFLNPAGIIFGDGAFVDVGGTAHFSTAHQLGFADGSVLVSGTASGSSFSMAAPARFGFLGNNQPIFTTRLDASDDFIFGIRAGHLTLSASDIVVFDTFVTAERMSVAAVGGGVTDLPLGPGMTSTALSGSILIFGGSILADGEGGGRLDLAAGEILLADRGTIEVLAQQSPSPALRVVANRLEVVDGDLRVASLPGVDELGGDMHIDANQIIVRPMGSISIVSTIEGGGGSIRLNAQHLLVEGGNIEARGSSAPGRSVGNIHVRADLVEIVEIGLISTTLSDSDGQPVGTTGNIVIDAGRLFMDTTGLILAENQAPNASGPGSITIRAGSMKITLGRISTRTETATAAGPIDITVGGLLELDGFGGIQSISEGLGDAGAISIRAGAIRMINNIGGPTISSETRIPRPQEIEDINDYTGSAGRILIETGKLDVIGRGTGISTSSTSFGNAGDIVIRADQMTIADGGSISSAALSLNLFDEERGSFIVTPGPGRAGTIAIDAGQLLAVTDGTISTATEGFGDAGAVTLLAERIMLGQGSRISSDASSLAPGQAGTVVLIGRDIALADGAQVTTGSQNAITAGNIVLLAEDSITVTASQIASTNGAMASTGGAAGNIAVSAPRITLGPGGTITTSSMLGAAGQIELALPDTGLLRLAGGANPAVIATSSGPGTGGRISISRPYALIADGARIEALGQQRGANVQLATDFFIRSADNSNLLLVDGDLVVDSQVGNVSSGIDTPDVSFGDAAGVLAGQCRAARSSGSVSRLAIDAVGPLALENGDGVAGGCR